MKPTSVAVKFQKNRVIVLKTANGMCPCGQPAKHVHHINERRSDNRLENLRALCVACHRRTHAAGHPDGNVRFRSDRLKAWFRANGRKPSALRYSGYYTTQLFGGAKSLWPSLKVLERICRVTGLEPGYLITFQKPGADTNAK